MEEAKARRVMVGKSCVRLFGGSEVSADNSERETGEEMEMERRLSKKVVFIVCPGSSWSSVPVLSLGVQPPSHDVKTILN